MGEDNELSDGFAFMNAIVRNKTMEFSIKYFD